MDITAASSYSKCSLKQRGLHITLLHIQARSIRPLLPCPARCQQRFQPDATLTTISAYRRLGAHHHSCTGAGALLDNTLCSRHPHSPSPPLCGAGPRPAQHSLWATHTCAETRPHRPHAAGASPHAPGPAAGAHPPRGLRGPGLPAAPGTRSPGAAGFPSPPRRAPSRRAPPLAPARPVPARRREAAAGPAGAPRRRAQPHLSAAA